MSSSWSVDSVLPMVIGVQMIGQCSDADSLRLAACLDTQFIARRQRYPHSLFVLIIEAPPEVMRQVEAVAARLGIPVIDATRLANQQLRTDSESIVSGHYFDSNILDRKPHQERAWMASCHVLYFISAGKAATDPGQPAVVPASSDSPFETTAGTEIIRLLLVAPTHAAAGAGAEVRRVAETGGSAVGQASSAAVMQRTDDFNRRADTLKTASSDANPVRDDLVSAPPAPGAAHGERFRSAYAVADELAMQYQRKVRWAFRLVLLLAIAATVCYGIFSTMTSGNTHLQLVVLLPYVLLLALAYSVFFVAKRHSIHDCFVEYRALAEALRVQYYWAAGGIRSSAADVYSHEQQLSLAWIRLALRALCLVAYCGEAATANGGDHGIVTLGQWIGGQKQYFLHTSARARRLARRAKILIRSIFVLGVCATVCVMLQSRATVLMQHLRAISLISFLCPSIGTALAAFVNKIGWTYQAEHNVRMFNIYALAEQHLAAAVAMPAKTLSFALGREALRENEAWAVFRSERSIDEPANPFKKPL